MLYLTTAECFFSIKYYQCHESRKTTYFAIPQVDAALAFQEEDIIGVERVHQSRHLYSFSIGWVSAADLKQADGRLWIRGTLSGRPSLRWKQSNI